MHTSPGFRRFIALIFVVAVAPFGSGCSLVTGGITDSLSSALLNADDPETVGAALPAYLIIVDGMIADDPEDSGSLLAGSKLYGAYAGSFVDDTERAGRLSSKARDYAQRALCAENDDLCAATNGSLDDLNAALEDTGNGDLEYIHGYGAASAGWVQANSSDWNAIAELPKIQALMEHVIKHDESFDDGSAHLYLGVLHSLRPPQLGGQPDKAKTHFERANELADGKNLMVNVLYAQQYARLLFDQELHDRLLNEVLTADSNADGYTLVNTLAQRQARALLESGADYF